MHLFVPNKNSIVVEFGVTYLQLMAFFYLLPSWTNGLQGYFRGMGDLKITLRSTFLQIATRVFFVYLLISKMEIVGIALSCLAGWIVMLAYEIPLCDKYRKFIILNLIFNLIYNKRTRKSNTFLFFRFKYFYNHQWTIGMVKVIHNQINSFHIMGLFLDY